MVALRTIKQLNEPQPISVRTGTVGEPRHIRVKSIQDRDASLNRQKRTSPSQKFRAIRSDGQWMEVTSIEDLWKLNDEWWRGADQQIERIYFDVILESNQRMTVFHDLVNDVWFMQAE